MNKSLGITVAEMILLKDLLGAKVLAGEGGLEQRITQINVMEVPDIVDWVHVGEFLLTTAFSIKEDITVLKGLIPRLKEKGVVGIGIKMKRYIERLPEDIINTANKYKFPIIEIPYKASYTDIMMPVLTEIISRQTSMLMKVEEIHNELIRVMLRGGSFKEILEGISHTIGNTVAIKDEIFDVVVAHGSKEKKYEIETKLKDEKLEESILNMTIVEDELLGDRVNRIMVPIYVDERYYGYLAIWEDNKKLTSIEISSLESSIPVIALHILKKISIFEIESRHKVEFFDDLLSRDEKRQQLAVDRAALFDFDRRLGYSALVISIKNIKGFVKETLNNSTFLYQLNSKIMRIIDRLSRNKEAKFVYGNKSDQIIVLYGTDPTKSSAQVKKEVMSFANDIIKSVDEEIKEISISIGIGRFHKEPGHLWKSYNEATRSLQNKGVNYKSEYMHFDDLGIYRIFYLEEMESELHQFYRDTLEPLVVYDKEKSSELVKTLQMFFQYGGNLKKVSEEMFTHYNTIVYRMQRIKDITGMNLENPNDRLNLQVSFKIFEMFREA
ncbi:PucR family transcriptional regulator ligand-binding domain-containing protein [Alkaliphilus sp. MSJ-5]|uniref:PucR family transcriptional regulator ligand-binding domain-containing protein n=1 Tax=Alkaliphilus flagellatus TaxID=2841507 RepID=A0ABS6FYK7_9FIRM|nr:PucR family transcriptional regulator ligand-binding domain-containing protein [Alkaliphilus flagellatus]MBU5675327.1 PucR family transcriptional regulator ligand-binding domain-containing protein [Alkaliphilus flagellatus]